MDLIPTISSHGSTTACWIMLDRYEYYNRNPEGLHLQDCVCRAISTAADLRYEAVDKLLSLVAKEHGCEKLYICCYDNLLEDILGYPRFNCMFQQTVEQVAAQHPRNKLIIRVEGHLTCSINGAIMDIWDCSRERVDCFWIVP